MRRVGLDGAEVYSPPLPRSCSERWCWGGRDVRVLPAQRLRTEDQIVATAKERTHLIENVKAFPTANDAFVTSA